jgi:hypothetical protein
MHVVRQEAWGVLDGPLLAMMDMFGGTGSE